jgi:hypothetical protein
MHKKNWKYFLGILLLILLGIYLINKKQQSTLSPSLTDFAFKDTGDISLIFMADMQGNTIELHRKEKGNWLVNNKFPADMDKIELLLETLTKMEVKHPVSLNAEENVIKSMAGHSIKVEIYKKKKKRPARVFYVGGPTPDYKGTYMMLEHKNKKPFVIHKPGFQGYLSEGYFFTEINDWRSKIIFAFNPLQIERIRVHYSDQPEHSYTLERIGEEKYRVLDHDQQKIGEEQIDHLKIKKYLYSFQKIGFIAVDEALSAQKDSILLRDALVTIQVLDMNKKEKELKLFPRKADIRTRVETREGYDKERMIGYTADRQEDIVILQSLVLERILWKKQDFLK